jgi:acyl-CoA thioesterase
MGKTGAVMGETVSPWDDLDLVVAGVPGRFTATISDAWRVMAAPIGGFVAALAVEGMARVLDDPSLRLRTVTSVFVAPVLVGPVEIDVTVLRRGRSVSQLSATVRNVGSTAGLTALAAFGASRTGFDFTDAVMPSVPEPLECPTWSQAMPSDFQMGHEPPPLWSSTIESRLVQGRYPWEPFREGPATAMDWTRFAVDPVTDAQRRAALCVLSDTMPSGLDAKVESDNWFAPSVDLTTHVFADPTPGWILGSSSITLAGDGYASARIDLWDPVERRLCATATQVMLFTFL